MSHLAKIELIIQDLAALGIAGAARNMELVKDDQFTWYQGQGKCDYKLRVKGARKGAYEIGIVKNQDGPGYSLLWDDYDHNLRDAAGGRDAGGLKQEYSAAVCERHYQSEGFSVSRTLSPDGKIILQAVK